MNVKLLIVFHYYCFNGYRIYSNSLVLFLTLVICVFSLYFFVSFAWDLSILLIFFLRTSFLFRWCSVFSCFQFLTLFYTEDQVSKTEKEELLFSIFFPLPGVHPPPLFVFFIPSMSEVVLFFILFKANHPLPSFVSVLSSGFRPYSVSLLSFSSSSFSLACKFAPTSIPP